MLAIRIGEKAADQGMVVELIHQHVVGKHFPNGCVEHGRPPLAPGSYPFLDVHGCQAENRPGEDQPE